jgi:hypothetical protein
MNLFRSLFSSRRKIKIIPLNQHHVTVWMWKSDKDMVTAAAKELRDNQVLRYMIDTVRNSSPVNDVMLDASVEARAIKQAQIEGYHLCLNNLESMGIFEKPEEILEPTFEDPALDEPKQ